MSTPNKTQRDHIIEIRSKIEYFEKQLDLLDVSNDKNHADIMDLKNYLQRLKETVKNIKETDIQNIENSLDAIKNKIAIIESEMPELKLVKKIVISMVAIILTAFLGLVWNSALNIKKTENMDEIAKRVLNEYQKGQK